MAWLTLVSFPSFYSVFVCFSCNFERQTVLRVLTSGPLRGVEGVGRGGGGRRHTIGSPTRQPDCILHMSCGSHRFLRTEPHGGVTLGQLQILPEPKGEQQMLALAGRCGKCQRCRWWWNFFFFDLSGGCGGDPSLRCTALATSHP